MPSTPRPPAARRSSPRPTRAIHGAHGQTLVEFALVLPIFLVLFLGILEFMFLFNAQLSLNYATRDATLVAAEAGNNANADCLILQQIDKDLGAPTDAARVMNVHIYSATETGAQLSSPKEQTYTRGGSTTCGGLTVPYTIATSSYPYNVRCSDLDRTSCLADYTGPTNTGVDIVGVAIDYGYRFVTPMGSAFSLLPGTGASLWDGAGMTMTASNAMRMEPIL